MRVKVCGVTSLQQLHAIDEAGADFVGMIFYHKSPRFALKSLQGPEVKKAKLKSYKVGVFVNATYEEVMKQIDQFGLDMVQLHGNETPYQCEKISNYIQVIKAFRITEFDHVEWKIKDFYADSDLFLFDSGITAEGEGAYGGTGRKFNWSRLKGLQIGKPYFLSGGISPTDTDALQLFKQDIVAKDLFAVDVNSKFEIEPGIKNIELVANFIKNVKQ